MNIDVVRASSVSLKSDIRMEMEHGHKIIAVVPDQMVQMSPGSWVVTQFLIVIEKPDK